MKTLLETLDGIKTYLIVAVILTLCVLHWAGKITMPPEAYAALFAIGLAALRAGVTKSGPTALLAACLALGATGCATPQAGQDVLVIRAEQLYGNAFTTCDEFLKWERANESVAGAEVHAYAEGLRKHGPDSFRALRNATKAYKYNRTPENKATLETWMATADKILSDTQAIIAKTKPKANAEPKLLLAVAPAVVIAAIDGLMRLVNLITGLIGQAKRNKEWNAEEEALVDAMLESALSQDHWKPKS